MIELVVFSNLEDLCATEIGIAQVKEAYSDIVLGTDLDSDREGIVVKPMNDDYQLMTDNQVGVLLVDFTLNHTNLSGYPHPVVVKTAVTSEMGVEIAKKHGVTEKILRCVTETNTFDKYLQKVSVRKNDINYVTAETIHSIGMGIYIEENQEISNVTQRV